MLVLAADRLDQLLPPQCACGRVVDCRVGVPDFRGRRQRGGSKQQNSASSPLRQSSIHRHHLPRHKI